MAGLSKARPAHELRLSTVAFPSSVAHSERRRRQRWKSRATSDEHQASIHQFTNPLTKFARIHYFFCSNCTKKPPDSEQISLFFAFFLQFFPPLQSLNPAHLATLSSAFSLTLSRPRHRMDNRFTPFHTSINSQPKTQNLSAKGGPRILFALYSHKNIR